MPWPTWEQAAIAAIVSILIWFGVRAWRTRLTPHVEPVAAEFALIAFLYALWRLARFLPFASPEGAMARAHEIAAFERAIHLPSELALQHFVLHHASIAEVTAWYYATVHVPAVIAFLVWLFFRHRDRYPRWRNALALVTAGCIVIRYVRVAPPRFLTDLGFTALSQHYGPSIYGPDPTVGVSDQFAAMPSIHVGWAAVVSFGIVAAGTSRWRWVFLPHVVITMLVVAATGDHWWLDGIVALGLLAAALAIDTTILSRFRSRRVAVSRPPGPPSRTEPAAPSCPASPVP